jgi:hypothetical protein
MANMPLDNTWAAPTTASPSSNNPAFDLSPLIQLRQVLQAAHPDWGTGQLDQAMSLLAPQGITAEQYTQYQTQIDQNILDWFEPIEATEPANYTGNTKVDNGIIWYEKSDGTWEPGGNAPPSTDPVPTFTSECGNGICIRTGSDGTIQQYDDPNYTPDKPSYTSQCANGTCVQFDENGGVVGTYPDPGYVEPTYGAVQYDENGNAFQIAPDGQIHYTGGTAPMGDQTSSPGWAGWGQEYQSSQKYNPTTGKMEMNWNKTPMGAEATLAQAQTANLPGNWYNTALMQRQQEGAYTGNQAGTAGGPSGQGSYGPGYSTFVGDTVGRLVSNKQGYDPNYDLQSGQNAMGVTPSGHYQDWNQGYQNGQALPGGGYQTALMSAQDYGRQDPTSLAELGGWFGTGFSDYKNPDDYYYQMQRRAAPSGGGTRLGYR